jgi:beta-glucosidase
MPLKELKAFKKINLAVNEEKTMQFTIALSELQKWDDEKSAWKLNKGGYTITVGENAADAKLTSAVSVK